MENAGEHSRDELVQLTADIVQSYLTHNNVAGTQIPDLISTVHAALSSLGKPPIEPEKLVPSVPIKKTITPDYLISLEDGRRYKALKRHLRSLGMTPDDYRAKWGLPAEYPMVAENYAKQRSELAKALGLGRKPKEPEPQPARKSRRKAA